MSQNDELYSERPTPIDVGFIKTYDFRNYTFTIAEYDAIVTETINKIIELGIKKGGEYAGDVDRLNNFRHHAKDMGGDITMEAVWRVYVGKHWDAIMQYEQDLRTGVERPRMESIEGRVDDVIVYMLLFKAMIRERQRNT